MPELLRINTQLKQLPSKILERHQLVDIIKLLESGYLALDVKVFQPLLTRISNIFDIPRQSSLSIEYQILLEVLARPDP